MRGAPTCSRKARPGWHLVFDGTNAHDIAVFTGLRIQLHNDSIILRDYEGKLFYFEMDGMRVHRSMNKGDVALFGEDDKLRILKASEFASKYDV